MIKACHHSFFMENALLQFRSNEFNLVHNWSESNAEIDLVNRSPYFRYLILKSNIYIGRNPILPNSS